MATISDMREALYDKRNRFRTLSRLVWDGGPIVRSTLFAQTRVECDGERLLIGMPLAGLSLRRVERLLPLKRHLVSDLVPQIRILREEMQCRVGRCDVLCEVLPDALPLADALASIASSEEAAAMLRSLDALQKELRRVDLSHNNLRVENILIEASGRLRPIRWYYATAGAGGDDEAIEALRTKIARSAESMALHDVECAAYDVTPRLEGHLTVRSLREGLAAVEDSAGWGFVDSENRPVVESKYIWVNDFREGRAEVETAEGMGLIDRTGAYVIPPVYEIVEFDERRGVVAVRDAGRWAVYDYSGCYVESLEGEEAAIPPPVAKRVKVLKYNEISKINIILWNIQNVLSSVAAPQDSRPQSTPRVPISRPSCMRVSSPEASSPQPPRSRTSRAIPRVSAARR